MMLLQLKDYFYFLNRINFMVLFIPRKLYSFASMRRKILAIRKEKKVQNLKKELNF